LRYWRVLGSGEFAATPCEGRLERGKRGAWHATLHMQDEPKPTAAHITNVTCLLCEPTLSCPTRKKGEACLMKWDGKD
jgi:hypothetical protein